jgi:uncharacterized cupredoxin-like copper-binding protein
MSRARSVVALAVALVLLFGLAACGGDDDDDGEGGTQPAQVEQPAQPGEGGQTVGEVSMSEFSFDPSSVSAAAGSTLTVRNEGSTDHDLRLRQDGEDVGGTEVFGPGQREELRLNFKPGEYEMFCSVPGHEEAGMVGSFTIE